MRFQYIWSSRSADSVPPKAMPSSTTRSPNWGVKKTVGLPIGLERVTVGVRPSTYAVVSAWCSRIPVSAISR